MPDEELLEKFEKTNELSLAELKKEYEEAQEDRLKNALKDKVATIYSQIERNNPPRLYVVLEKEKGRLRIEVDYTNIHLTITEAEKLTEALINKLDEFKKNYGAPETNYDAPTASDFL